MSSSRKMKIDRDNVQQNPSAPSNNNLPTPPSSTSGGSNIKHEEKDTKNKPSTDRTQQSGARSAPAGASISSSTTSNNNNQSTKNTTKQKNNEPNRKQKNDQARNPFDAPVRKLSINLIKTYKHINEVYYAKKAAKKKKNVYNDGHDDENYDYKIKLGEVILDRYEVKEKIGKGSFGQVVRAYDKKNNCHVAIKIIKSKRPFFHQAKTEIELLNFLNEKDPKDEWFIVRLLETFLHHKHQCLVFEMLSYNLYDLLKNTRFRGVSLNLIKKFARQILKCLAFLALPEVSIIHCDLKPENILLRDPKRSAIKLIDFGSSCRSDKRMYTYIQSRFYRSPEVMLGLKYGVEIDMWSLGCILIEMHTGEPLFNGVDEFDQMSRVIALRGMPPLNMIKEASKTKTFFDEVEEDEDASNDQSSKNDKEDSTTTTTKASATASTTTSSDSDKTNNNNTMQVEDKEKKVKYVLKEKSSKYSSSSSRRRNIDKDRTIESILGVTSGGPGGRRSGDPMHSERLYRLFVDLIDKMLEYDPKKRINPIEALKHQFFIEFDAVKQKVNPQTQAQGDTYLKRSAPPPSQGKVEKDSSSNDSKKKAAAEEEASSNVTMRDVSNTATDTTNTPTSGNNTSINNNIEGSEKEALPRSSFEKRDAYTQTPVKGDDKK